MSAEGEIKSFVERVLRIKAEQDELAQDTKEIYKEAKGRGFNTKVISTVVGYVRKRDRKPDDVAEQDALFELYLAAYEGPSITGTENATRAAQREASGSSNGRTSEFDSGNGGSNPSPETIDPETGEIIEPGQTSKPTAARNGAGKTGVTAGRDPHTESQSEHPCTATDPSASTGNASDEISSIDSNASSHDARAAETGDCISVADQFSRAPVETDPLREQADVTTSGPYPREAASGDPEKVQLPNQQTGCQSISPSSEASSSLLTTTGADALPPVSAPTNSEKPHCLKLKDGHCRISFETSALCATCNAAKARATA